MTSKGYHRFKLRMQKFREDIELTDVIFRNQIKMRGNEHLFRSVTTEHHPRLSAYDNTNHNRILVTTHLKRTMYVAFIKDLYEEVTEYIRYILMVSAENVVNVDRLIGEHTVNFNANQILSLRTRTDIVKMIMKQVFRKLENERSTPNLIRKTNDKLGLNVSDVIIDEALPYLEIRHLLVHSDGKPDEMFSQRYPNVEIERGRIKLNFSIVLQAYNAINQLVEEFDRQIMATGYIPRGEIQN